MVQRAVSSWSLHRTLGRFVGEDSAANGGPFMDSPQSNEGMALLDLPAALREHGYDALQLVHFHLPSRDRRYLDELRSSLDGAGITLDALLIDDGDLTGDDADHAERWIGEWMDVASTLGAKRVRIPAGKADPTPETIRESATRLARLASGHTGVRVVTENWWGMLPDADAVRALLDQTGESVGLLIDLGNWRGSDKYDQLARIAPMSETCHAKCRFTDDGPDREDYVRCLRILREAGFDGPLALIYDGPDEDEWGCLDVEYEMVVEVFGQ